MKSKTEASELFKELPAVHEILNHPAYQQVSLHRDFLKQIVQEALDEMREAIRKAPEPGSLKGKMEPLLHERIQQKITDLTTPSLKRVVNGTGIILHTNLGRAPLAEEARKFLQEVTDDYLNLEIELGSGKRGERNQHIENLLTTLTGAEAAMVVNNNAAAVLLSLNTLCRRKEVVVSRGELVEIGGSFRMPEVMRASGAKMVEIGTTNKTHLSDYQNAISEKTGAILKVHTSNYRILGFTSSVGLEELVQLAHQHDLPLIYDMGSGALVDLSRWGFAREPVAREVVAAAVDVITFSGDKVLGGPQAGIIIGKKTYVERIRKNHLTRALRCDKLTYAALEATLRLYLEPEKLTERLPVFKMLSLSLSELKKRAKRVISQLSPSSSLNVQVVEVTSQMGSGALPLEEIPSVAISITSPKRKPAALAHRLRSFSPPIIGYIENDAVLINLRTVREDELPILVQAFNSLER